MQNLLKKQRFINQHCQGLIYWLNNDSEKFLSTYLGITNTGSSNATTTTTIIIATLTTALTTTTTTTTTIGIIDSLKQIEAINHTIKK